MKSFKLPLILDGATGTNLYSNGLERGVCVESFVLENPEVIKKIQEDFYSAGTDLCMAPTFSANRVKLKHFNLENRCEEYNQKLYSLTAQTAKKFENKFVAVDISPTGVFVKPFSDTPFEEVYDVYCEQINSFKGLNIDFVVGETLMSLYEARAIVLACKQIDAKVFITVTIDENGRTLSGATPLSVLLTLQEMGIDAFGINCSFGPELMLEPIREMVNYAKIPIIAKPNAGFPDPVTGEFNMSPQEMGQGIKALLNEGVSIVGACCGSTAEHIKEITKIVNNFEYKPYKVADFGNIEYLTSENKTYKIDKTNFTTSEYIIKDSESIEDDIFDLNDEEIDILTVVVEDENYALEFCMNTHYLTMPFILKSDNIKALDTALFNYQGRCAISKNCKISENNFISLTQRYGCAIL